MATHAKCLGGGPRQGPSGPSPTGVVWAGPNEKNYFFVFYYFKRCTVLIILVCRSSQFNPFGHYSLLITNKLIVMALVLYSGNQVLEGLAQKKRTELIGDHTIELTQSFESDGVAGFVWDAAVVLSKYLSLNSRIVADQKVLELGAGTGLVGICCHKLGAKQVISTDHSDVIHVTEENFKLNNIDGGCVSPLNWGGDVRKFKSMDFDVIIGADVIYIQDTFSDLLKTLNELSTEKTALYLSCKIRYDRDTSFLNLLRESFSVLKIDQEIDHTIDIFICKKIN